MKALCWYGKKDVRVETVPDPQIVNPRDAIIKITTTAICGSDLHLYGGYIPTMKKGDILGHENMGEVIETGTGSQKIKSRRSGRRAVYDFLRPMFLLPETTVVAVRQHNPNAWMAEKLYSYSPAGLFGYSHMLGGYAGGQAEYLRVPFADVGCLKIPDGIEDEKVLFLSDIFPTGYMAAENCDIEPGDTVAVWGCGPVGQFAIKSAYMLGAERVIAIDRFPERLELAEKKGGAETINYEKEDLFEVLNEKTGGRGPDRCIDAVGMECHTPGPIGIYDTVKQSLMLETDRPHALAPGDHLLPQRRHRVGARGVRRFHRQVSNRRGGQQGTDD